MTSRTRARFTTGVLATVALIAGACSSSHGPPVAGLGVQAGPTTAATAPPATAGTSTPVQCDPANPTRSLRPTTPLPAPGAPMPAGSFMEKIQKAGQLVVGVDQTTYLFGYLNPATGNIEGFDIDLLKQVARAIFGDDTHLHYVAITSAQRIPYVQQGKVDIVARTMTITCDRWKQVDFSTEYYGAGQRVLVPANSTAQGLQDLGGKRVCATAGSTSSANIKAAASHPVAVEVTEWTDCLAALQQGKVDAISTDDPILAGLQAQDLYTKMVGDPRFSPQPYGMAISKDHPEFVRFVNAVLEQIRANGTWTSIYNKWVGHLPGVPPQTPPVPLYF
jgi:polar amino acid transport system substrate-binding protein